MLKRPSKPVLSFVCADSLSTNFSVKSAIFPVTKPRKFVNDIPAPLRENTLENASPIGLNMLVAVFPKFSTTREIFPKVVFRFSTGLTIDVMVETIRSPLHFDHLVYRSTTGSSAVPKASNTGDNALNRSLCLLSLGSWNAAPNRDMAALMLESEPVYVSLALVA